MRGGCTAGVFAVVALTALAFATSPAGAAPGDLDRQFSRDGSLVMEKVIPEYPTDLATLSDDSVVITDYVPVGGDNPYDGIPHLLRVSNRGRIDRSFGKGGYWTPPSTLGRYPEVRALLADRADRILVLVTVYVSGSGYKSWLARLTADGQLDSSFGSGGVLELGSEVTSAALAVDGDGGVAFGTDDELVRLRSDGSPDPSFGGTGRVTVPPGGPDQLVAVEIRPTGEVIAASGRDLIQFNADGSFDAGFGASGRVIAAAGSYNSIADTALSPDGSIYVQAGSTSTSTGPSGGIFNFGGLIKVNRDGTIAHGFSTTASVNKTPFRAGLVVDSQGRILETYANAPFELSGTLLARFMPDGTADESFGFGGVAAAFPAGCFVSLDRVALDSSGRVLGGGSGCGFHRSSATTVVRLLTSGSRSDADADRLPDDADRCPRSPSRMRGGCPALERRITIKKRSNRILAGEVVTFYDRCGSRGEITVFRKGAGKDTRVQATSQKRRYLFSRFGALHYGWKIQTKRRLDSGSYYARISSNLGGGPGVCSAAKSKTVAGG